MCVWLGRERKKKVDVLDRVVAWYVWVYNLEVVGG